MPFQLFLALIPFACVPYLLGAGLDWGACGIGALGWVIAMILRVPASLALKASGQSQARLSFSILLLSGPVEEICRLVGLIYIDPVLWSIYAFGFGWAAIEIFYLFFNGAVATIVLRKDPEKAQAIQEQMDEIGAGASVNPLWSTAERLSAAGLHIGLSFWIAWNPYLLIPAIILHSGMNLAAVLMLQLRAGVPRTQLMIAVLGGGILLVGLIWFS